MRFFCEVRENFLWKRFDFVMSIMLKNPMTNDLITLKGITRLLYASMRGTDVGQPIWNRAALHVIDFSLSTAYEE